MHAFYFVLFTNWKWEKKEIYIFISYNVHYTYFSSLFSCQCLWLSLSTVCIIITFSDGLIVFVKFMFYSSSDIGIS